MSATVCKASKLHLLVHVTVAFVRIPPMFLFVLGEPQLICTSCTQSCNGMGTYIHACMNFNVEYIYTENSVHACMHEL